jgi:transcription initiation factor TFIIB
MLAEEGKSLAVSRPCAECGNEMILDFERGEKICINCGIVDDSWENRCAAPAAEEVPRSEEPKSSMMYDMQLPTVIGDVMADGRSDHWDQKFDWMKRLNNFTITRDSRHANSTKAVNEIDRITGALGLPGSVTREAQQIYHRGLSDGTIRGKSIVNMSAAAVLVASKVVGVPCSSDEIERVMISVDGRTARRYYRVLVRKMNLRFDRTDPSMFVSRTAGRAGLSVRVERRALEILAKVSNSQTLADKRPLSIAAGALYISATELGEGTSQLRLANAAGVTPITIRKRSSEISRILATPNAPTEAPQDDMADGQLVEDEPITATDS